MKKMSFQLDPFYMLLFVATSCLLGCSVLPSVDGRLVRNWPSAPKENGEVVIRFVDYCSYQKPARTSYTNAKDVHEYLRGHNIGWKERASNYTVIVRKGTVGRGYTTAAAQHLNVSQAFLTGHRNGIRAAQNDYRKFEGAVERRYRNYMVEYHRNEIKKKIP